MGLRNRLLGEVIRMGIRMIHANAPSRSNVQPGARSCRMLGPHLWARQVASAPNRGRHPPWTLPKRDHSGGRRHGKIAGMSLAVVRSRSLDGLDAPAVSRRGAAGQRAAELHARRPGRHRSEGVARARARGAAAKRLRLPAQQAHHGEPGAGRPAQGIGALRSADRAGHPGRGRADRHRAGWRRASLPASCRWPASCGRCAARWRWRWRCAEKASARTLVLPAASAARRGAGERARRARRHAPWPRWWRPCCRARPPWRWRRAAAATPLAATRPRPARRQRPGRRQAGAGDRRRRRRTVC